MAEVRFAIVGLGVGKSRAEMAAKTAGAKLVCVCDLVDDRAKEAAETLGCDWYTDYDEVLRRDDVDAVGIFTPSGTHAGLAIKAARAGKHVFTTKPMDIRVDRCDKLIEEAEKAGVILAVDFGQRYSRQNRQIKMALEQGRLGRIFFGDLRMKWFRAQEYYDGGYPPGWRSRLETEGGSMANQGVHYVDLLQWFLGPVRSVRGRIGTLNHRIETEDAAFAFLEFESGAWGVILTTTCNVPRLGTVMEISGDNGSLVWKDGNVELWHCQDRPDSTLDEFTPDPSLPNNIIEDMVSAITKGTKVAVDGYEGRKSVEIFCAAYRSHRTGRTVRLGT